MNVETQQRNAALRALDLKWARELAVAGALMRGLPLPTDEVLLVSMHKARYEVIEIEPALRQASGIWLREQGYSRQGGLPWPADAMLPTELES